MTRSINSPESHLHAKPDETPADDVDEKNGSDSGKNEITELTQPVPSGEAAELKGITTQADLDQAALKKAFKFAVWASVALFVILIILVPLPLFGSSVVYGVKGFTAWTVIGILWMFFAIFAVVLYPVYESREALVMVSKGIFKVSFLPPDLSFGTHADSISAFAGYLHGRRWKIRRARSHSCLISSFLSFL